MHRTAWLLVLAALSQAESNPELITVACSRRPDLPFCKNGKYDAERDILLDRLNTKEHGAKDDYVKRRDKDAHVINQQRKTLPKFTTMHKRSTDRRRDSPSVDKLVIPPPLPTAAKPKRKKVRNLSDPFEKWLNSESRHERGSDSDVYQLLRRINALTAGPVTSNQENVMPQNFLSRRLHADQATAATSNNQNQAEGDEFRKFSHLTDTRGVYHPLRSRSPFSKPALWEANPDNPHNRDHANVWWYNPYSVKADWLHGQIHWGGHWGVPAAGVGGTQGFSAVNFPSLGQFLNIPDDYD
ncbi:hypothetical protein GCK32_002916 [Trichostrongylus colubriformis]|uniref:Uncharacterized protein n=1 Tax=Trichostrongylus colubriformis TaxID=6319 RepID=A0AAN8G5Q9_TRICO